MSATSRPVSRVRIADEMWRDADRREARGFAFDVSGADAGDEIDAHAVTGEPRRLIGCGAAGLHRDRRAPVGASRERSFRPNDDVHHHVADDKDADGAQYQLDPRIG